MIKILLIEDNEENRDMLGRRLQRQGFAVCCAVDGPMGVAMAVQEAPDLILMDIALGDMDGWEATQRIKSNPGTAAIPIIALTAHALATDREKSFAVGCAEYDTKPVDLPRLLGKIRACLAVSVVAGQAVPKERDLELAHIWGHRTVCSKLHAKEPVAQSPSGTSG